MLDLNPQRIALLLLGTAHGLALAQEPVLIRDFSPREVVQSSGPSQFVGFAGIVYFVAGDELHGRELWRTDGTPEGTWLVADLCAGRCRPLIFDLAAVGDRLFMTADDGISGRELWVSDGTAAGTRLLRDFCHGPCFSDPEGLSLAGTFVFTAAGPDRGVRRLWATDGTPQGTVMLHDGSESAGTGGVWSGLARLGDAVLFSTGDGLWRTDGRPEGTWQITTFPAGTSYGRSTFSAAFDLPGVGERVYFAVTDLVDLQLWSTDGTAGGTGPIGSLVPPGTVGVFFSMFRYAQLDGSVYFTFEKQVRRAQGGLDISCELWRTDGSTRGTRAVTPLAAEDPDLCVLDLIAHRGRLYFGLTTELEGRELWVSDGSASGTRLLRDVAPGRAYGFFGGFIPRADDLLFIGGPGGQGLWRTDGTFSGTRPVLEAEGGLGAVGLIGDRFFFSRADDSGFELWVSDGTPEGSFRVRDLAPDVASSDPELLGVDGDRILLTTGGGHDLWISRGEVDDPRLLYSGDGSFRPRDLTFLDGDAFFAAPGLWRSDGTAAGTREIGAFAYADNLTAVGSDLWFGGDDGVIGHELWRLEDGESPRLIRDIALGEMWIPVTPPYLAPAASYPAEITPLADSALLAVDDVEHGVELWRSDGTEAGTMLLKDIETNDASRPAGLTRLGSRILFAATDREHGRELWSTDGTAAGTRLVADLEPGPASSEPVELTVLGDRVVFLTGVRPRRAKLWASDGTAAGTTLLASAVSATAGELTPVGDRIFFVATLPHWGRELWVTDGTRAGTRIVADLIPGPTSSNPRSLTAVTGRLAFAASDAIHGHELWITDGTAVGTRLVVDLEPGPRSSSPGSLAVAGSWLVFAAGTSQTGRELWALPLTDLDSGFQAAFVHAPAKPVLGKPVIFRDRSSGEPTSWCWRFGDEPPGAGECTAETPHTRHAYRNPGSYTVTLRVSRETPLAESRTTRLEIEVSEPSRDRLRAAAGHAARPRAGVARFEAVGEKLVDAVEIRGGCRWR